MTETAAAVPSAPVAPPLDPEAGPLWRAVVENVFGGNGIVLTPDTLPAMRSFQLTSRETLLGNRAVVEETQAIPGADGAEVMLSIFTPAGHTAGSPGIYWIHGGGMVLGDRFAAPEALDLADDHGAVVVSVEYRLAPEHPSPAPGDDCYAGLCWFAEHAAGLGVDPGRIVMGGTSAGGGLAAATALRARDQGGPSLAGLLLCCPMLDDRQITVSTGQFGDDVVWSRASNTFGWAALLGDRAGTDDVSIYEAPGRATDLSGLAPVFVDVGSADIFRDEDVAFASSVWASGGSAELHVWPGGFHGFELMAPAARISQDTVAARRRWLARTLGAGGAG
jgi:acetyl esterase/lipase